MAGPPTRPSSGVTNSFAWGDLAFCLAVVVVYTATMFLVLPSRIPVDRMMVLADQVLQGRLDSATFKGTVDSVDVAGRYYIAVGPLQVLPYLPFAALHLWRDYAGHLIGIAVGIPAALLALPLARAWGSRGAASYWVAGFVAFGTLLFYVSVFGDFYYLAHAESFLALTLFLIEWAGRRRGAVLGICLAFSFLARPTTALVAVPFGLALLWQNRHAVSSFVWAAISFAVPIGLAIGAYGWFNWVRFGSPTEAGYAISYVIDPVLEARRRLGVFSISQIPENLRLALLSMPRRIDEFPYLTADRFGLSMLLVSPALLTSLRAGFRAPELRLVWIAAAIVAVPVFLYYGGGANQYGFRYSLDFTPFLIALVAAGSARWKGWPERLLIVASVASVGCGVIWHNLSLQP
jgi:hypothetical protein